MLDPQFVAENAELVKENCRRRQVQADVDRAVTLYQQRKELTRQVQALHQRQNELQKQTGREKDPSQRQALIEEGRQLRSQVAELENHLRQVEEALRAVLYTIPNLTHPEAPPGSRPEDNRVLRTWGEPPQFSFRPKDHVTLAEKLDLVDFEAGSAVTGPKFYFLKNEAVLLELALVQYAFQTLLAEGFTPVITPDLAKAEVVEGIGFIPRGPETQIYSVAHTDLCLIATAEITLGGMHRDQLLEENKLPLRYVGLSHCFRTEAGAPGREGRGLFRVHQFTKVEMFVFCVPEQSEHWHQELLRIEEKLFQGLGIAYRVIDTCAGDLGGPAYRKFDIEAWMPGRGEHGEYAEVTSTSNCTDYQARRLNIRYRPTGQKGTRFVHTLNGTAIATSRAIVAILENYQRGDGSVVVPQVLRPWVGKELIGP
ncbi:MAG: serine--tRNA ligase [Gemmatales bacterium]|nr:serine--tRNA ligase [Gemmatales bacterium]MCS7159616.1 serine--tRNA ligase [Gemmatales bacterium]MDW8174814.1 serine--tRNA ligase [Gemmatales bacterium]MDW8221377.1 serine--tRNA ligase [Gemmatales bacterium]